MSYWSPVAFIKFWLHGWGQEEEQPPVQQTPAQESPRFLVPVMPLRVIREELINVVSSQQTISEAYIAAPIKKTRRISIPLPRAAKRIPIISVPVKQKQPAVFSEVLAVTTSFPSFDSTERVLYFAGEYGRRKLEDLALLSGVGFEEVSAFRNTTRDRRKIEDELLMLG